MSICLSNGSASPVSGSSLAGHLRLRCEARADGVPFVARQDFRAPVHMGKGHLDRGWLVLNLVNPTAGFFDGDHVEVDVEVGPGARLVLGTPAASRVYPTRSGKPAANRQRFSVEANALLEWNPEPFIPHAGASYEQRTHIGLDPSSSLLFFEWVAPGRVAMGEVFAYRKLRWELDLRVGGKLVARERYDLCPDGHSLESLQAFFPQAHYLSVYAAGVMTERWPVDELDALTDDDVRLGHGPLQDGVHVIRALCADSVAARRLIGKLRELIYSHAGLIPPALGRVV
jgi:urease accessory protein